MTGRVNCPVWSIVRACAEDLFPGARLLFRAKIGGERQLINITVASAPYRRSIGQGRTALYVNVFGWGWKGAVQVKKLLKLEGKA